MTHLLDSILSFHENPLKFISQGPMKDNEINLKLLAVHVEENSNAWYIKHNGSYIMYCSKHSKSDPATDGPQNLEMILAELWARYTRKKLAQEFNYGYQV